MVQHQVGRSALCHVIAEPRRSFPRLLQGNSMRKVVAAQARRLIRNASRKERRGAEKSMSCMFPLHPPNFVSRRQRLASCLDNAAHPERRQATPKCHRPTHSQASPPSIPTACAFEKWTVNRSAHAGHPLLLQTKNRPQNRKRRWRFSVLSWNARGRSCPYCPSQPFSTPSP